MSDPASTQASCQNLVATTVGTLEWEWDGRFDCGLAPFAAADADTVRAAIEAIAPQMWTVETIASAPQRVQDVAAAFGLRSGQLLFTSEPAEGVMLYAAWWPWSGGQRVSVRVGADGPEPTDLAAWLGLQT